MTSPVKKLLNLIRKKSITNSNLKKLAKQLEADVRKRTRLGFGVDKEGAPKKALAKTADSTRKSKRKRKAELSNKTSVNKSNLTDSGQMLDSLSHEVNTSFGKATITLYFDNPEADRKARWAEEGSSNRPKRLFMNLTNKEIKRFNTSVQDLIDEQILRL